MRLKVRSRKKSEMIDVTAEVDTALRQNGLADGLCHVFVPHTTAGVLINENADPAVCQDTLAVLERLVPWQGDYAHAEGNAAAHVKSILVGTAQLIPVREGALQLGRWQGIFFCEFDGPRSRELVVSFLRLSA